MTAMKKAIVLGGTFPHRHLIKRLKDRGYHTILIDYYENPIAKEVADEHIQASTLDKDTVLQIARDRGVDLVITACVDQANVTACYVAEKLGLPHPYSYETSLDVTDKEAMKRIMTDNGIPTARHYKLTSLDQFDADRLKYPLIVKPADSNSSKGVRKIERNDGHAEEYISKALRISRNGAAIIEEFKTGREIGVDCMIKDHKAYVVMTRERRKIQSDSDGIQQIVGSFWPADITRSQLESLRLIAERIASAFKLDNTPLMIQTIVDGPEINVIEFGARIGGGENYHLIRELTGYDIIDESINSFLGEEIGLDYHAAREYLFDNYIYMSAGRFGEMRIDASARDNILYSNVYRKPGAEVGPDISSNNRVGVFVVKARDTDSLQAKADNVIANMEVYGFDGEPAMRKDIYGVPDKTTVSNSTI